MSNLAQIVHNPPVYEDGIGLYVHVPFCETKCPYCDFNTYAGIEAQMPDYLRALTDEINGWGRVLSHPPVRTIFLGGGTPSYLPAHDIDRIHATIGQSFDIEHPAEITMECNPGDVTAERANTWLESGVNRVSMGAQSFDDELLSMLGRRHTAAEAARAFQTLRSAGFVNLSLDLMYGLINQSFAQWSNTLDAVMSLAPDHISLYSLQVEPGTPLAADVSVGRYSMPDDDLAADMYEEAQRELSANGFSQYEISNWSQPGMESRHNLIYWHNEPYLGVGPGAHSWIDGRRFWNLKSPRRYTTVISNSYSEGALDPVGSMQLPDGPVEHIEITTPEIDIAETMMMGMRLNEGVSLERFKKRFGVSMDEVFPQEISRLQSIGLVVLTDKVLGLSERGRLLGNEVFAEFVGEGKV
ncbi:MAG: radical SAM family heme chaperone HemW [Chloroflexi bacterium]|nr:radical SAM family heme chaperone HemW [Chloroflexota bacterium]